MAEEIKRDDRRGRERQRRGGTARGGFHEMKVDSQKRVPCSSMATASPILMERTRESCGGLENWRYVRI